MEDPASPTDADFVDAAQWVTQPAQVNLADGCLEALQDAALINLTRLSLAGNRFQTLDALEPLSSCVNLRDLDLFNCAVTEIEDYRDGVFGLIPALLYLDGFDA